MTRCVRNASRLSVVAGALLLPLVSPSLLEAQATVGCLATVSFDAPAAGEPFDRPVYLDAGELELRAALSRVAEAAGVRISFSSDLLPAHRRVCASFDGVALGTALASLLHDLPVEPTAVGTGHVVLAPAPRDEAPSLASADLEPGDVVVLPALHVETERRAADVGVRTTGATVLDRSDIARRGVTSLASLLNAAAPGFWLWGGSGAGVVAGYGGLRGASSFGQSAPKVYVDGVELANPHLLGHIPLESIDEVEVIGGPQGSALYGANAIGGVIRIRTRHDAGTDGRPGVRLATGFGYATGAAPGMTSAQEHRLSVTGGDASRSYGLGLSGMRLGETLPGTASRQLAGDASGRIVGRLGVISGMARYLYSFGDVGGGTIWARPGAAPAVSGAASSAAPATGEIRQFTAGLTASTQPNEHWVHSATAGVDAYAVDGNLFGESALAGGIPGARASASRVSLRASSTGSFELESGARASITFAAEHSVFRQGLELRFAGDATSESGPRIDVSGDAPPGHARTLRVNTGASVQADFAFDRLALRAGLRFDHAGSLLDPGRWAALPVTSASWLAVSGPVDVTLRAAYGRAIRWPESAPIAALSYAHPTYVLQTLTSGPEQQSGIETGADIALGDVATLRVTRFDQTVSGLRPPSRGIGAPVYGLTAADVGRIRNRGWEAQATVGLGDFELSGTASLVDSRVERLAGGLPPGLQPGDRMPFVPALTVGAVASYVSDGWTASLSVARSADWVGYDAAAIASADGSLGVGNSHRDVALSRDTDPPGAVVSGGAVVISRHLEPDGTRIVSTGGGAGTPISSSATTGTLANAGYALWRAYGGLTQVSASVERELGPGVRLLVTGENLFGSRSAVPGYPTAAPGRTVRFGVRVAF